MTGTDRSEVTARQRALAAEHAAVYGYGIAGAWLRGAERTRARAAYAGHLARRDRLSALLVDAGQTPVAAEPAYALPPEVRGPEDATALARVLEERVAAVYADLVAASGGEHRRLPALAMQEAAVRAAEWRGGSLPFPGLPERAPR